MDRAIVDFMHENGSNVSTYTSRLGTHYIVGTINDNDYIMSKQNYYILTKKVRGEDRYVGVYLTADELLVFLRKIKNNEPIKASEYPNEMAKLVAATLGVKTI